MDSEREREPQPSFLFGPFRFEPSSGELFRDGEPIHLQPKPAAVLHLLLEKRGHLISRQEIRHRVWGDTVLNHEQRIHSAIRDIRRALDDDTSAPTYVETMPTKGYRFVAPAKRGGAGGRITVRYVFPLVVLLAIGGLWILRDRAKPTDGPEQQALLLVRPVQAIGDDSEQLSSGLWEELLVAVGRVAPDTLGVIGRTTALKLEANLEELKQGMLDNGIELMLETTLRHDQSRVRVSAALSPADSPEQSWSSVYERDLSDLLGLQADIAADIARSLGLELAGRGQIAIPSASVDPSAYTRYLTGRHQLSVGSQESLRRSLTSFEESIAIDDQFAPAHVALARALYRLDRSDLRAAQSVQRAIDLDPRLGEANYLQGTIALLRDWNWQQAQVGLETAVALEPGSAVFRLAYADFLASTGVHREAVAQAEIARVLDPLSGGVAGQLGWLYLRAREPQRAVTECLRAKDVVPGSFYEDLIAHDCLVLGFLRLGDTRRAVEFARGVMALFGALPDAGPVLESNDEETVLDNYWRWRIDAMMQYPGTAIDIAISQLSLGDTEGALSSLRSALDQRSPGLVFLATDPAFDPLRDDPAFLEISRQVGNPFDSAVQPEH